MSKSQRLRERQQRRGQRRGLNWRVAGFAVAAFAILGIAAVLALTPLRQNRAASEGPRGGQQVVVNMAGFSPSSLTARAGAEFNIEFINPDSKFHTDGGGWHQFAIDALGVDVRIPPRSQKTVTLRGVPAGTYEFYCDLCCGGKENPSMRGILEVTG